MYAKANLGSAIEELVTVSCDQYRMKGIANIQKIPTPFRVVGRQGKYLLVYPEKKGTVDYIGEVEGIPFAMEVKSTGEITRYPLDPWKREEHQREFLEKWHGLKYFLISFSKLREEYMLPYDVYENWVLGLQEGKRKSIPLSWFRKNCPRVKPGRGVELDFLAVI